MFFVSPIPNSIRKENTAANVSWQNIHHHCHDGRTGRKITGNFLQCSMPLQEHRRFHEFTPLFTVISSVPQVLLFEVILDGAKPCLTRPTTRSSPLLRRVIDASIEGTCMILIGVRTDDVAEEPWTPEHDRLGDRSKDNIASQARQEVEQSGGGLPGW